MSKLQFIVDTQWSILFLLLVVVGIVLVRRMSPESRQAIRAALLARGVKASVGSLSLELGAPASVESVATAAAPDEQLVKEVVWTDGASAEEQVQQLRRDAVEQVMREAAEWGWTMAQVGFRTAPTPSITWNGDKPEIDYGFSTLEKSLINLGPRQGGLNLWAQRSNDDRVGS